ncbi:MULTISPECIES: fimbrial biogenesis chaperone [Pseudomonas]|uniref:fimbrial biogenesis chaperone n=1 Tax=Pseudomonas TaxID=286 RepID=UPI0008C118FD|nr:MULTISPECIES: molecular chaperone [Pseudomonas]POA90476.1 molecular chaperone [Pseudomonas protegens]PZP06239.1 MAG: molecular chaperone [Pseudomonas protegens]SES14166.1 P pilus assembly protein, chaperone PapD [Pseudomonas sp. NFPP19]
MFYRHSLSFCAGLLGLFAVNQAVAGISLSSTRLIFDGQHKEAGITVRNSGEDVLIQSWIDTDSSETAAVPFAVTPPLVRVSGDEQQILRVIYEGAGMPTDRESVVWLNVQEIPKAAKSENTLQLAVRQRIKVFFRPAGLKNNAYLAPSELTWRLTEQAGKSLLVVNNPGRYHVSIADITLQSGTISEHPFDSMMIAPGEQKSFPLKQLHTPNTARLSFSSINDYGAQDRYGAQLSNSADTQASLNKQTP